MFLATTYQQRKVGDIYETIFSFWHVNDVSIICKFVDGELSIIRAVDHRNEQYYRVDLNDCTGFIENEFPNTIEGAIIEIINCEDHTPDKLREILIRHINTSDTDAFTYLSHDDECTQFLLAYEHKFSTCNHIRTITFFDDNLNIVSVFGRLNDQVDFNVYGAKQNMYFTSIAIPLLLIESDEFTNELTLQQLINQISSTIIEVS